jgi:hypothetical protein
MLDDRPKEMTLKRDDELGGVFVGFEVSMETYCSDIRNVNRRTGSDLAIE